MRSTGEVMGIDLTLGQAFAKSQAAAGDSMPTEGAVFMSLADRDKPTGARAAGLLVEQGFRIIATAGTARYLRDAGVPVERVVAKLAEASGNQPTGEPTAVELLAEGEVQLVVNSPRGRGPRADGRYIRMAAGRHRVPLLTTASAALAAAKGIAETAKHPLVVRSLQEYHEGVRR